MIVKAHGKINLSLDIVGRRENGYHDIASVFQSVALCDEVEVTLNSKGTITVKTDCSELPDDEHNIAYKACKQMIEDYNLSCGVDVYIRKNIPIAGGMAGGSTDAAAVIRALNELCDLHRPIEELMQTGAKIGADVPFCIQEKPAFVTGIGEKVMLCNGLPETVWILLVNPNVQVSTKKIYDMIDEHVMYQVVDNKALLEALASGNLPNAKKHMINVMETVTGEMVPQVRSLVGRLKETSAIHAMMSGSGATCFGIYDTFELAEKARCCFEEYFAIVTKPF